MSIASEIQRLSAAKASLKDAIEAKGVTIPDATRLDDFSAFIDRIQQGSSYTRENEVYDNEKGEKGTVLWVDVLKNNTVINISNVTTGSSIKGTIDWGDGTVDHLSLHYVTDANFHTYSTAGRYKIVFSNDFVGITLSAAQFTYNSTVDYYKHGYEFSRIVVGLEYIGSNIKTFYCSNMPRLVTPIPPLPPAITSFSMNNNPAMCGGIPYLPDSITAGSFQMFEGDNGLNGGITNIPKGVTNIARMFYGCHALQGRFPQIPQTATSIDSLFRECWSLTGELPAIPDGIKTLNNTFDNCRNAFGEIPVLPSGLTSMADTFFGCHNLEGAIPKWPSGVTNAYRTYNQCVNLTGVWKEINPATGEEREPTDEELMPSSITNKTQCVTNASDAVRQHFLTTWGGTRAS